MDKQDYEHDHARQTEEIPQSKDNNYLENGSDMTNDISRHKKSGLSLRAKKILLLSSVFVLILLLLFSYLAFTRSGRRLIYKVAGNFIYEGLDIEEDVSASSVITPLEDYDRENSLIVDNSKNDDNKDIQDSSPVNPKKKTEPRQEDYVTNYLIFGIEEIFNAKNTDAIMIASINTKDNTVKLASLLRDTYIARENEKPKKLNAFFALSGSKGLVEVVEEMYRIKIDGYAYINFESFEKVIDYLGGIAIELGEKEANYLNRKNYISNPENRNVKPGWNELNGNQALGYCRVRYVETLGGANDDYGRTLRQRRVLGAIFNKYKSKNVFDLVSISKNILGYIKTNVTQSQIEKAIEDGVENKITRMDTMRVPVNGAYEAPIEYNGISYPLILDWDANITELYKFIFLDTEEEAKANLEKYR